MNQKHIRLLGLECEGIDTDKKPEMHESDEEVRKRAEHALPVLKWRELPWEIFKVVDVKKVKGNYGPSMILTLHRKGEKTKVWHARE